jgi:hypothetical protein
MSEHQTYGGILTDLGMAAAISVLDRGYHYSRTWNIDELGSLREDWFSRCTDDELRTRVTGMASAAATALARLSADELFEAAQTYGMPIPKQLAKAISKHFAVRRDEVLTYRR